MVRDCWGSAPACSHSQEGTRRQPRASGAHIIRATCCAASPRPRHDVLRVRCDASVPAHESAEGTERLLAGDLLLEDARHERIDHEVGARHPPVTMTFVTPRILHPGVVGHERGHVIVLAENHRHTTVEPAGSRPVGPHHDAVRRRQVPPRRSRAVRRHRRPPDGARTERHRRVAETAPQAAQDGDERHAAAGVPLLLDACCVRGRPEGRHDAAICWSATRTSSGWTGSPRNARKMPA